MMLARDVFVYGAQARESFTAIDVSYCEFLSSPPFTLASVKKLEDEVIHWLPVSVASKLKLELGQIRRALRTGTSEQQCYLRRPSSHALATKGPAADVDGQPGERFSHPPDPQCKSGVLRTTLLSESSTSVALALLSLLLRPILHSHVRPGEETLVAETSDEQVLRRIENACAVLLCVQRESLTALRWEGSCWMPTVLSTPALQAQLHIRNSFQEWLQYFLCFFLHELHDTASRRCATGQVVLSSPKHPTNVAAHPLPPLSTPAKTALPGKGGGTTPRFLPDPLRGAPAGLLRHPLHFFGRELRRTAASIRRGDENLQPEESYLSVEKAKRPSGSGRGRSMCTPCAARTSARGKQKFVRHYQRVRGPARRRRLERSDSRSSSSSSSSSVHGSSTSSDESASTFRSSFHLELQRVARPSEGRGGLHRTGTTDSDDDIPLIMLTK